LSFGDGARAEALRPVTRDDWIAAARPSAGQRGADRARPSSRADGNRGGELRQGAEEAPEALREDDFASVYGNRCQYTGELLKPEEGSLDHVVPRSRGGADAWENLVWSSKDVNTRKGNRLPQEAGLKLLSVPRAPKELPVSALLRNAHGVAEWKLFLKE